MLKKVTLHGLYIFLKRFRLNDILIMKTNGENSREIKHIKDEKRCVFWEMPSSYLSIHHRLNCVHFLLSFFIFVFYFVPTNIGNTLEYSFLLHN